MSVETAYGKEIISNSCSVWSDGCNLYCRTNLDRGFEKYALKDKCNEGDIARSRCVDSSYKKTLPDGWSLNRTKKQVKCI